MEGQFPAGEPQADAPKPMTHPGSGSLAFAARKVDRLVSYLGLNPMRPLSAHQSPARVPDRHRCHRSKDDGALLASDSPKARTTPSPARAFGARKPARGADQARWRHPDESCPVSSTASWPPKLDLRSVLAAPRTLRSQHRPRGSTPNGGYRPRTPRRAR